PGRRPLRDGLQAGARRRLAPSSTFGTVKVRIEGGIVIHLELPIHLESCAACQAIAEQGVETGGQVCPLLDQPSESRAAGFDVRLRGVGTLGLSSQVENLEGEDGQTVDHRSGAFRMQTDRGVEFDLRKLGKQAIVYFLDRIVELLIEGIEVGLV